MISSIHIQNFQSHKDTRIDFAQGVNALVGLSDNGKTAVLRALNWVINNRPLGTEFRSHWGGDTIVTVQLSSGHFVARGRSDKENWYEVGAPTGRDSGVLTEGILYRAFGQEPPPEVTALFNLNDINISAQMDAPFLLASHPGEVAQILNRAVRLDVIDSATSAIRKKKLNADQDLRTAETRVRELESQRDGLAWLADAETTVERLEQLEQQRQAVYQAAKGLSAILTKADDLSRGLPALRERVNAETLLDRLDDLVRVQRQTAADREKIRRLCAAYSQNLDQRDRAQKLVGVDFGKAEQRMAALAATKMRADKLDNYLAQAEGAEKSIRALQKALIAAEQEFAAAMPDVCPLCGRS